MQQKSIILVLVISLVVLIGGALLYSTNSTVADEELLQLAEKAKGSEAATVVLREYSDFQCPACASFAPVMEELAEKYPDTLRIEFHHYPLPMHRNAVTASQAAEAAGVQGKFWEMHDLLFAKQNEWSPSINPRSAFVSYATELGLDVERFSRDMNSNQIRQVVRDETQAGRELAVDATPTFYLNGEKMELTSFPGFINEIEVALGVADPAFETAPTSETPADDTNVKFGF